MSGVGEKTRAAVMAPLPDPKNKSIKIHQLPKNKKTMKEMGINFPSTKHKQKTTTQTLKNPTQPPPTTTPL
ncbi:hypothetical protein TI04_09880 [Achromatium sp. WMS2]|nr:hypothetical protein TI04_09880 [Achromatium sp. WMS2]